MKNRIKEILENSGRTQAWVGRQLGKTRSTINDWCHHRAQPQLFDAYKLAKLLDIPMDELIIEDDV